MFDIVKTKTRILLVIIITIVIITTIGIIIVGELTQQTPKPTTYADSIYDLCYDDDQCVINEMYSLSQNNSTQTVLTTIDVLIDLYADADFYCHPVAHHIGEFLYGYLGRDLKMASNIADYRCASGIMHGLVENTIQIENMLDGKKIESVNIKEYCEIIYDALGIKAKNECAHGIGHSIIKIYNYNTTQAVQRCNDFDDDTMRYMCNGGLFMQNMSEYAKTRGGDFVNSDLYYPCNEIDADVNEESALLCYRYQANYFLSKTNYDVEKTQSLCINIEDKNYIPVCIKGISSHLAKNNFNDIDKTYQMCNATPQIYQQMCVIGAIESLTRFVSDDKALAFCKLLDKTLEEKCESRFNSLLDNRYN